MHKGLVPNMRGKIDWKEIRKIVKELLENSPKWRFPTVRSVFYHLGDVLKVIPLTSYGYKKLDELLVDMRKKGEIPFGYFDVKRGESSYSGSLAVHPSSIIEFRFDDILHAHEYYGLPYLYGQHYHIEIWIEKKGLIPFFEKAVNDMDIKIRACEGYVSWEFVYANVQEIKKFLEQRTTNTAVVLYFGDLDPSGVDITRHVENAIRFFGVNLIFHRVALYPYQVKQYNLPLWPERMETIEKIMRDPRAKWYFQKYGKIACELDSFVSKAPNEFMELIKESVQKFIDSKRLVEKEQKEQEIKEKIRQAIEKRREKLEELKREIIDELSSVSL